MITARQRFPWRHFAASATFLLLLVAMLAPATAASAATTTPPFTQCPAVGDDTSCGILLEFDATGALSVLYDSTQGPYDGVDDTLVGVQNDSNATIPNVTLTGADPFGFDGDGICQDPNSETNLPGAPCAPPYPGMFNPQDPTGYGGPASYFTDYLQSGGASGTVNFVNGLAPGASTYFSLEGKIDAADPVSLIPRTTLTTSLSGGGSSGSQISVPAVPVTDSATLSGDNAASATGTITYDVYFDSGCTSIVNGGAAEDITTPGTLPPSSAVTLPGPGTYYWRAIYSGDSMNAPSSTACGDETATVPLSVDGEGCIASLPAPTNLSVAPGEKSATVSWAPVISDPPGCLQGYVVTPNGSGAPIESLGPGTTTVISGLADGATVTFTVAAANGGGVGPQSQPTSPITIGAPAAPSAVAAARIRRDTLKVSFKTPAAYGAAITSYKAVCRSANGGVTRGDTGTASPLGVKLLTQGKKYTCTVTATNSRGRSPASAPSKPVEA